MLDKTMRRHNHRVMRPWTDPVSLMKAARDVKRAGLPEQARLISQAARDIRTLRELMDHHKREQEDAKLKLLRNSFRSGD